MATASWKDTVTEPDEKRIFEALAGPDYTWRTVTAVARQTGLDEDRVLAVLTKYSPTLVRMSKERSASGKPLVGLIEKVGS